MKQSVIFFCLLYVIGGCTSIEDDFPQEYPIAITEPVELMENKIDPIFSARIINLAKKDQITEYGFTWRRDKKADLARSGKSVFFGTPPENTFTMELDASESLELGRYYIRAYLIVDDRIIYGNYSSYRY